MMSVLKMAAHSVVGSGAARLRSSSGSGFLAPSRLQVLAPVAPSRPYRYTPPVQVGRAADGPCCLQLQRGHQFCCEPG
jgi:hypothetical protein